METKAAEAALWIPLPRQEVCSHFHYLSGFKGSLSRSRGAQASRNGPVLIELALEGTFSG